MRGKVSTLAAVVLLGFALSARAVTLLREYDANNGGVSTLPDSSGLGGPTLTAGAGNPRSVGGFTAADFAAPIYHSSGAGILNRAWYEFSQFGVLTGGSSASIFTAADAYPNAEGYTYEGYFRFTASLRATDNSGIGSAQNTNAQNEFIYLAGGGSTTLQGGETQTSNSTGTLFRTSGRSTINAFLPRDVWLHIVKVHDPFTGPVLGTNGEQQGEVRWYVNGVLVLTDTTWSVADPTGLLDRYWPRGDGLGNVGQSGREVRGVGYSLTRFYRGAMTGAEVLAVYQTFVPEPGTLCLAGFGGLLLAARRRR
jgi:hypothetical protein